MRFWGTASSLRWQLLWKLTLVQGAILVLVNVGFILYLLTMLSVSAPADRIMVPVIAAAIGETDGNLAIVPTANFERLATENPALWFRASDGRGRMIGYGAVPPELEPLASRLVTMAAADIRGGEDQRLAAAIATARSRVGELQIFYGGRTEPGSALVNFLYALKIVYLPFTLIPMLAAIVAVPLIVGRSFAGLDRTTEQAARIDLDSRGARLPSEGVVDEIQPLVAAVNAAFRRVDEGYERRQRFLANAAHELRTPIAILQTRIETLADGPERARLLGDVARLGATAEQLLNMQRLDQEDLRLSPLDLVAVCEQVVADIAPLAIASGYDLSFSSEPGRVVVEGHAASLGRAVTNLVMNAVEHAGGQGTIGVSVNADGSFEVIDEGPGIARQHRTRVFEPFYRVRPNVHGAGLGLSLVQQIVDRHGGTVEIMDTDSGARLRIVLRRV